MHSSIFAALLFFFAMSHRCLWASDQAQPTTQGSPRRAKTKWTDDQLYGPYKGKSLKALWSARADFFKSGKVPTDSNEVQRLWQWHRAMDEADPAFGSKMPINFYGKAVDQYGKPVSSATVELSWGKGTNQMVQSLLDGSFNFSGVTGAFLGVSVYKAGYATGRQSDGFFNYADFFDDRFHLPNPTNPVIFRLQKLEGPEPMYVCSLRPKVDVAGTAVWVDVASWKKGETGDVGFSVVRDPAVAEETPGYTLSILAPVGGGVIVTNEEFMFHAPATGYSERIDVRQGPAGPDDQIGQPPLQLKLYLKTVDNKYAAIKVNVGQFARPEAWVDVVICFNPSGSRNLEMGPIRLDARQVKALRGAARDEIGSKDKVKH